MANIYTRQLGILLKLEEFFDTPYNAPGDTVYDQAKFLLENGADPNDLGWDLEYIVEAYGYEPVISLLVEYGARPSENWSEVYDLYDNYMRLSPTARMCSQAKYYRADSFTAMDHFVKTLKKVKMSINDKNLYFASYNGNASDSTYALINNGCKIYARNGVYPNFHMVFGFLIFYSGNWELVNKIVSLYANPKEAMTADLSDIEKEYFEPAWNFYRRIVTYTKEKNAAYKIQWFLRYYPVLKKLDVPTEIGHNVLKFLRPTKCYVESSR